MQTLSRHMLWAYINRGTSKVTVAIAHAPWYNYVLSSQLSNFNYSCLFPRQQIFNLVSMFGGSYILKIIIG